MGLLIMPSWAVAQTPTASTTPVPSKNLVYVLDKIWPGDGTNGLSLKDPEALSCAPDGSVYIADTGNNRIVQWKQDKKVIRTIGKFGAQADWANPPEFNQPSGILIHPSGRIYVGDTLNHRIVKLDADGMVVTVFGGQGSETGFFNMPRTIANDRYGNIWVLDTGNSRIQIFSAMGEFQFAWGSFGTGDYQLNNPMGMAINPIDQGIIADTGNFRFEVFNDAAAPVTQVGWYGNGPQQFKEPSGIAVSKTGLMAIANADRVDFYNDNDGDFEYMGRWKPDSHWDRLKTGPRFRGIACDRKNRIYVTDVNNNWLVRLKPVDRFRVQATPEPSPTPPPSEPYTGNGYPIR